MNDGWKQRVALGLGGTMMILHGFDKTVGKSPLREHNSTHLGMRKPQNLILNGG